ncbi:MAG: MFS transporter, partial [Stackebrandtia sp.]
MTTTAPPRPESPPAGPRFGRDFVLMCVVVGGAFVNFGLLASTVPLWAAEGGSDNAGVGAVTGVMMAATVASQLCVGLLLRRFSMRQLLAAGAFLMGAPAAAYLVSADLTWVLGATALRGVGFGFVTVAGAALVGELVPAARQGKALATYGAAVGAPQLVFLPLGLWIVEQVDFTPVFLAAAATALLVTPLVWTMNGRGAAAPDDVPSDPITPKGRWLPLAGPGTAMLVVACGYGGVLTFLPLALSSPAAAAGALPAMSVAIMAGRWAAGAVSD